MKAMHARKIIFVTERRRRVTDKIQKHLMFSFSMLVRALFLWNNLSFYEFDNKRRQSEQKRDVDDGE